jgi:hypothetical protein
MVIWLVGLSVASWPKKLPDGTVSYSLKASGPPLLMFILLVLLGWKVFGPPIHQ